MRSRQDRPPQPGGLSVWASSGLSQSPQPSQLATPGFGSRGSRSDGDGQNAGEVAADVDLQLTAVRREDALLHQRAQYLAGLQPLGIGLLLQRVMEFRDLGTVEGGHLRMEQRWRWTCPVKVEGLLIM